ncbi:MAG: O-antigen ligase family protein [Armatimonadetes bacterium]|nr:O-antigen ligase family protein [Armatimonadota bacterium]
MEFPIGQVEHRSAARRFKWLIPAILVAAAICLSMANAFASVESSAAALGIIGLVGLVLTAGMIFLDIRYGLAIFLIAASLSPRSASNFRIEDLVVPLLVLAWSWRILYGVRTVARTPMTLPMILVSLAMIVSTLWGLGIGMVPDPLRAGLIIGKRIEYFFLFFLALNTVRTKEWGRALVTAFLVAAVVAGLIGMRTAIGSTSVGAARAVGLDEKNYNTFAGFLLIGSSIALAYAMSAQESWGRRLLYIGSGLFLLIVTLHTYSREGYVMIAAALVTLGVIRYRKLLPILALVVVAAPFLFPASIIGRFDNTIHKIQNYKTADPGDNSLTARVDAWKYRWNGWIAREPILGCGVGSVAFSVDDEFMLRLAEGGFLGCALFIWLLVAGGAYLFSCARKLRSTDGEPLAYGLLAAYIALLVQSTVAAAWTTIRTMEPFWLLTGVLGSMVAYESYSTAQETVSRKSAPKTSPQTGLTGRPSLDSP